MHPNALVLTPRMQQQLQDYFDKVTIAVQKIRDEIDTPSSALPARPRLVFSLRHERCPAGTDDDPAPELVLSVAEDGCGVYTCPRCAQQIVGLAEFAEE
jgi:hypothetical protein